MDDSPEVIRQQMEETRASLSEKLESLEQQVVGTVQDARDAVADTVQSVKDTFDIKLQTRRHPWAAVGSSVALGFVAGSLIERLGPQDHGRETATESRPHRWPARSDGPVSEQATGQEPRARSQGRDQTTQEAGSQWLHSLAREFEPEISKLKGLALGAAMSVVREMVAQAVPEPVKPRINDVFNDITVKLGGEPIRGSLWNNSHDQSLQGERNEERNATEMGRAMGSTQGTREETVGRHNGR